MKTYKCGTCGSEATHILSFRDMKREVALRTNTDKYAKCLYHVGTDDEIFHYCTIEEYTALRAMYEL